MLFIKKKIIILILSFCFFAAEGMMSGESLSDVAADQTNSKLSLAETNGFIVRSNASFASAFDDPEKRQVSNVPRSTSVYIPQNIEIACCLRTEAKCCFFVARWLLQPLNVILPLASTSLVAAGEYYMKDNSGIAKSLNLAGLICSAADFVASVLLIKVNNKLARIDRHFEEREEG